MDQESGGLEDLTDEGIAKFLEETIGEEELEILEEFKSSELFDEFLQQLNPNASTPTSSRRTSIVEPDEREETSTLSKNENLPKIQDEPNAPSTSSIFSTRKKKTSESEHTSWSKRKRKSSNRETTSNDEIDLNQSLLTATSNKKPRKSKQIEPEAHHNLEQPIQHKSVTKLCSSRLIQPEVAVNERKYDRKESLKNKVSRDFKVESPIVLLYDLVRMKKLFPNGVLRLELTPKLLEEIRKIEQKSLKNCRQRKKKQVTFKEVEEDDAKFIDETLKKCSNKHGAEKLGPGPEGNVKQRINQVLENVQLYQAKEQQAKYSSKKDSSSKKISLNIPNFLSTKVPALVSAKDIGTKPVIPKSQSSQVVVSNRKNKLSEQDPVIQEKNRRSSLLSTEEENKSLDQGRKETPEDKGRNKSRERDEDDNKDNSLEGDNDEKCDTSKPDKEGYQCDPKYSHPEEYADDKGLSTTTMNRETSVDRDKVSDDKDIATGEPFMHGIPLEALPYRLRPENAEFKGTFKISPSPPPFLSQRKETISPPVPELIPQEEYTDEACKEALPTVEVDVISKPKPNIEAQDKKTSLETFTVDPISDNSSVPETRESEVVDSQVDLVDSEPVLTVEYQECKDVEEREISSGNISVACENSTMAEVQEDKDVGMEAVSPKTASPAESVDLTTADLQGDVEKTEVLMTTTLEIKDSTAPTSSKCHEIEINQNTEPGTKAVMIEGINNSTTLDCEDHKDQNKEILSTTEAVKVDDSTELLLPGNENSEKEVAGASSAPITTHLEPDASQPHEPLVEKLDCETQKPPAVVNEPSELEKNETRTDAQEELNHSANLELQDSSEIANSPASVISFDNNNDAEDVLPETIQDEQNSSPDDNLAKVRRSVSPKRSSGRKSTSPERGIYKRKNVIESSSDAGDDLDENEIELERKKSSDEEQIRKSLPFERKRDQSDPRSKKFDKFEHERQRKLGEKKKGKEKSKENMALEEILNEKPLIGSFRIPKKTSGNSRRLPKATITPLAGEDVPKENLQFERCRKGSDKDKRDKEYGSNRGRDFLRYQEQSKDFGAPTYGSRLKKDSEPNNFAKDKDDGRIVVLTPDSKTEAVTSSAITASSPDFGPELADDNDVNDEPHWGNDNEDEEPGCTSSSSSEDNTFLVMQPSKSTKVEPAVHKTSFDVDKNDCKSKTEEKDPPLTLFGDPEVPIECVQENVIAFGAVYLIKDGDKIDLPGVDTLSPQDATVQKLAWWLSRSDLENDTGVNVDSTTDDSDYDDGACSFLNDLDFTDSDEDSFPNDSTDRRKPHLGLVDEFCGRSLLNAKYRIGPGDKFENIFHLRSGASYEKEKFQARCTLCDSLVIGKTQLSEHIVSDRHKIKMSTAGLGDTKVDKEIVSSDKKIVQDKVRRDKEPSEKTTDKQKEASGKSAEKNRSRTTIENEDREKSKDEKDKRKDVKCDENSSVEKRKGSKDDRSDDGQRKGKDSSNKSETRRDSRSNRSRSRSPRRKRTRSRSPRRKSKSPRGHRKRSRSIQRIPRSPSKLREQQQRQSDQHKTEHRELNAPETDHRQPDKRHSDHRQSDQRQSDRRQPDQRQRRRSTSAERVEKFLARTNRRSRSPSKGYNRKRNRRSRSKSPMGGGHILPRRDNKEFNEKLVLTAEGLWTDEMEQRWKLMEAEQAIFMEQYGEKKKMLNDSPESHPNYADEWTAFWEKRYSEVQNEGLDADEYDYIPEWKEYWTKRLRDLLNIEYENGIKNIKESHGMDLDSLHKIRLASKPEVLPQVPEVSRPGSVVSTPQDLATPSTPSSVAAPAVPITSFLPLLNTTSVHSRVSGNGEDYTARSMSISDGGEGDIRSVGSSNGVTVNKTAPTVVDIMSTWEKLKSGELTKQTTTTSTNSFSTSKRSDNVSNADSGSIASFDFDGFDLPQVLHLMTNLEDQLSFFADKVKEYFKKAEELDLKKKNKSYILLDDEDFVVMLFNVRDRFMAMIRANILSKDILKRLNLTVYALNNILDAPQCQKHRTKISTAANTVFEKEKLETDVPRNVTPERPVPTTPIIEKNRSPWMNLSCSAKEKIAFVITEFLQNMGREDLSDEQLHELLEKVIPPKARNGNDREFNVISDAHQSNKSTYRQETMNYYSTESEKSSEQRYVTKTGTIVTTKMVGSAVPTLTLPEVNVAAMTPVHDRGPLGCREEIYGHTSAGEQGSTSASESGRRSPFSRRGFSGNPAPNPYRDKETLIAQSVQQGQHQVSAIDDVLPRSHSSSGGIHIGHTKRCEEIYLSQVTANICSTTIDAHQEPVSGSSNNLNRLRIGLEHIIMKEKNSKQATRNRARSPNLSSDEDVYYKRGTRKKRKRKSQRKRRHESRSSCSSDSEEKEYQRLKRRKRRRQKDENRHGKRKPLIVALSDNLSEISSVRVVDDRTSLQQDRQAFREGEYINTEYRQDIRRTTQSPSSELNRNQSRVKINMPKWDKEALSDISSIVSSTKSTRCKKDNKKNTKKQSSTENEMVLSVSKTFWTAADAEENEDALSSVSSKDLKEPETNENEQSSQIKLKRSYRGSIDKQEKEPGELTDSDSCGED